MDPLHDRDGEPSERRFSTFIRHHQAEILELWESVVRKLPIARDLDRPALIDHLPRLLERIASMADELVGGGTPRLAPDLAEIHALERLDEGFDLGQVVTEYAVLRDCIGQLWSRYSKANADDAAGVRALNQAIDKAVSVSVKRYTLARERTLQSLDRISAAALETHNLSEFLDRLLHVLLETTAAVDAATILLRDGDILRTRAAVGLGAHATTFAVRVGEGFAGMIAETRRPHILHAAATSQLHLNPAVRDKGIKALFGIPLINGSEVMGVATMGSLSATDFSLQDRQLFTAMGYRATSAIFQHMLRDAAESKARQQLAVATLGMHALATRDPIALLEEAVLAVRTTLGAEFASVLEVQHDGSLRAVAESGWGPEILGTVRLRPGEQSQAGYTLLTGQPVIVDDVSTESRFNLPAVIRDRGIHSGICVGIPVPADGARHYGVLCSHTVQRRAFTSDDVTFMQSIAHVLGTAVALRRSERERELVLAQEQTRRAELEAVIESIPDAVFIGNAQGISRCNTAALDLVGWDSQDELQELTAAQINDRLQSRDLDTGQPIPANESPYCLALQGVRSSRNAAITNVKTGREIVLRSSAAPIYRGSDVIGAVSVNADLTEQRRAHEAVSEALAQQQAAHAEVERSFAVLDSILTASALGIALIDTDLRYVRVNAALAAINGPAAAHHIGRTVREVLGEAPAGFLEPLLLRVMETREAVTNLEFDAAPPSTPDQLRSFLSSYVPVVTPHGEVLGIGAVVIEITDRKRMETALREREEQFRTLADNIPQLAWMADATGDIFWYNRRWYELTGTTLDDVKGYGWQVVHHPDHIERVVAKFRDHIRSGEAWEDTFPLRAKDGTYRWFLSRAVPVRDEQGRVVRWFGTNTDVTEQRFMVDASTVLSQSLDHRATLERIAELAVPTMADWCIVDLVEEHGIKRVAVAHADPDKVARAREYAMTYAPVGSAQRGVSHVIETGAPELVGEVSEAILREIAHTDEQRALARELGLASYMIVPLVARGRTFGAISLISADARRRRYTVRDLETAQKLGRHAGLAVDNARLFEEAQRSSRMREELLAVVSHDLRNPLGVIHLAATMLLQQPTPPQTRKPLESIERASSRMDHLIGDLVDVASIQAGRLSVEKAPEDPESLVKEVIDHHEPMAKRKGITLVRAGHLHGEKLACDRQRILQVFGNLVGNAIKFCRTGDTITIRSDRDGAYARFTVADSGPGIAEDALPHVFDPYWSAAEHAKSGTGLGLYISRGIVEAHGGRVWAESKPGQGATFCFTVPRAPA